MRRGGRISRSLAVAALAVGMTGYGGGIMSMRLRRRWTTAFSPSLPFPAASTTY